LRMRYVACVHDFHAESFRNPLRVSPSASPVLEEMANHPSPAYRDAAWLAARALHNGTLVGIHSSSRRFLITLRQHRARPVAARVGALFQCLERRSPPSSEDDLPGWIVLQDGYRGGRLVMVHELSHFANRLVVWRLYRDRITATSTYSPEVVAMVRARLLDEIAARHVAFLAETGVDPDSPAQVWPSPGALFACAVKIASYPEIYTDPGYVTEARDRGRDALRDLVGSWFPALATFPFYREGTRRARVHKRWLEREAAVASLGRNAPERPPEGTL